MPGLNTQILLAAVIGIAVGLLISAVPADAGVREAVLYGSTVISSIFIGMLKMVLVPLLFTSIAVGVANLQAHQQANRVWVTTVIYFISTTALAMTLGLIVANVFKPGAGISLALFADTMDGFTAQQMTLAEFFLHFFANLFQNPFTAFAEGSILAIVVFALFFGAALVAGGARYKNIVQVMQEFLDVILGIIGWIMRLAPLGIMALLIKLVAEQDASLFSTMGVFIVLIVFTTLFHGVVVLPAILYVVTRRSPLWLWRGAREAIVTAFATGSSSASIPVTLRCAEKSLKVPRDIAGFVIPVGATMNMDGTALYEAVAALFVANLVGVELNLAQQLIVFLTAMVASTGAPGIPSAGMVTMVMVLQSVGLPAEAIAILLPIDRLLDTVRTAVNVEGDIVGSLVVHKLTEKSP